MVGGWLRNARNTVPDTMKPFVRLGVLMLLAGCATVPCPPPDLDFDAAADTGLRGQVLSGPRCGGAVSPNDPECIEGPFSATFLVFWGDVDRRWGEYVGGCQVAAFHANEEGRFELALPPGRYTIFPGEDAGLVRSIIQRRLVEVEPGGLTEVTLRYFTGIR